MDETRMPGDQPWPEITIDHEQTERHGENAVYSHHADAFTIYYVIIWVMCSYCY